MHTSSYNNMHRFVTSHCAHWSGLSATILDIGSMAVNGSYRELFQGPDHAVRWEYIGVDVAPGENVDVVLSSPYRWEEIKSRSADIIVSGQALEHIEYFWLTVGEMARAIKPNGRICLIAPSSGPEHRYPVDCWRFYPDGMRALARYWGFEPLECYAEWDAEAHPHRNPQWQDCVLIAAATDKCDGHSQDTNPRARE